MSHSTNTDKYDSPCSSPSDSQSSKQSSQEVEMTQQEKFHQALLQAQQLSSKQDFQAAIAKLRLLTQKINFFKQTKKEYDKKLELVCLYNLAATYQKQWNLHECLPFQEKFIALLRSQLSENLKASGSLPQHEVNKHWFKLKTMLVRILLQYCAVLSQIGDHKKALKVAIEVTSQLKQLFRRGFDQCNKQISKKQSIQKKKNTNKSQTKLGSDKIEFSYSVLLGARDLLQQLTHIQTYADIIEGSFQTVQAEMQEVKSKIYYWKSNPQNNVKMLRQSFQVSQQPPEGQERKTNDRNLLGLKKNQNWLQEFTIAKVMFMTPINYMQFCDSDNLIFEFNQRNRIQKVILLSAAYFSLSIELRFLEQDNDKQNKKDQKHEDKLQELQKSQIFHLKAIEVVCKHIKENSAFVSHLVINYHKHYKNRLNIIEQENSIAEYSELYDPTKFNKNNLCENNETVKLKNANQASNIYCTVDNDQSLPKKNKEKERTVFGFRKQSKKKIQQQEEKSERSRKMGSSSSFSRFQQDINTQKDKTLKKSNTSKMIIGKFEDLRLVTDRSEKQISSKYSTSRSNYKKSLSKSKNVLKNSITLKQNKSQSPQKEHKNKNTLKESQNLKDSCNLKESTDMSKRDFKKKSPEPSRALDLLKKSGSMQQISLKGSSIYSSTHLKKKI